LTVIIDINKSILAYR